MSALDPIEHLVMALQELPGIGPRSARRIAYTLLERKRPLLGKLAEAMVHADRTIRHCRICNNFTSDEVCPLCRSEQRDSSLVCVVESPSDVTAIEATGAYGGRYFVLLGKLSPIDGFGPEALHLDKFAALLDGGEVKEVILATNATVEGEATALYLAEIVKSKGIKASRIAHGVPLGGELEFVDRGTLGGALSERRNMGS